MKSRIVLLYCVVAPLVCVLGIYNGEDVKRNSAPFMVNLRFMDKEFVSCGGVIITDRIILTAANCVKNNQSMTIVAGDHNILVNDQTEQYRNISRVQFHPETNLSYVYPYDIAAVYLDKAWEFNEYVQPINLPTIDQCFKGHVISYGWGFIDSMLPIYPEVLQKLKVLISNRLDCRRRVDMSGNYKINAINICTENKNEYNETASTFYSDWGGPVVQFDDVGEPYLVGIISAHGGMYPSSGYDIHVNVAAVMDIIERWLLPDSFLAKE